MPTVSVILLAAGYGTRLQRDLRSTAQLSRLSDTPKPLLPLSGKPILTHWTRALTHCDVGSITVITNSLHHQKYYAYLADHPDKRVTLLSNGSTSNDTRHGAVADLAHAMANSPAEMFVIIAGDTLLPATDINHIIQDFLNTTAPAATLAYQLSDISDSSQRGMLAVETRNEKTYATMLVEKPPPEKAPSRLACAPVYLLRGEGIASVATFLDEMREQPLQQRDAPGHWLSWLIQRHECLVYTVPERVDIGGLSHYKDALWRLATGMRAPSEPAVGRAFPRVGMLGNPSDGYGGKVIGFALSSEGFAEVVATESDSFHVLPNQQLEIGSQWPDVGALVSEVAGRGLGFGARKVVLAAVTEFAKAYKEYGSGVLPNCELSYSTTIPARIGLAGSSALVLATFRALARFCATDLKGICADTTVWPELMRKAETEYLGIACGLMDRVIQVLHGVVWMDFSEEGKWKWERLKEDLPDMWLTYAREEQGECSGKVHGSLTKRFLEGDDVVKEVTQGLIAIVDEGRLLVEHGEWSAFPELVARNFELRCRLVGTAGIGKRNLQMVDVAKKAGFAAKMTGSGGCALCVPNPVRQLSVEEEDSARREFEEAGFTLRRIQILKSRAW